MGNSGEATVQETEQTPIELAQSFLDHELKRLDAEVAGLKKLISFWQGSSELDSDLEVYDLEGKRKELDVQYLYIKVSRECIEEGDETAIGELADYERERRDRLLLKKKMLKERESR